VPVTKVIEVVGRSPEGSDDAVRQALTAASRSIRGISRAEVVSIDCDVADGAVTAWNVRLKVLFPVESR
jgi:flavin-binding protein dodecin